MNNTRFYLIYKHTNLINNKVYIGQTCQKTRQRWNYGGGYRHNAHFYAAIKKYGWNNFKHEILFTNLTKQQADELERQLIAEYNACDSQYGYNVARGGATNTKYASVEEAEQARKRIQHTAYKKMVTNNEYAQKMREKSLQVYYSNKTNPVYIAARSRSNRQSRTKVHEIRMKLKEYYIKYPKLFTSVEIQLAFAFKDRRNYYCNSSKQLLRLLNSIEERIGGEEK